MNKKPEPIILEKTKLKAFGPLKKPENVELDKDTQFNQPGGVNKRGFAPLKKRGDN